MEQAGVRFVGIGIGTYRDPAHLALGHALGEVERVAALLGWPGEVLRDPTKAVVQEYLDQQVVDCLPDGGALVLMWCGHAVRTPGVGLRLVMHDSRGDEVGVVLAAEVVAACAASGADQLLFIVDTCFSGAAVPTATEVASELLAARPPNSAHVWVGVLASCAATDTAVDGVFGRQLLTLLENGPSTPDLRRRWSAHNRRLRGDDMCDALLKEWVGEDQLPQYRAAGNAQPMLPNPLFDPGAPEQVVEHLLQAARGGHSADHRSWFTGRTAEVNQVVGWVTGGVAGVRVITGAAGTGKSTIAGRVVSAANPVERQRLLVGGLGHADPGERSVHAHLHARGRTADQVAELLDAQLVRAGVLVPADTGRRNAAELVGVVQRATAAGAPPPVVVVDGLDEARDEAFSIAAEVLVRLGRHAVVVVATRDLPRNGAPATLLAALAADEVLNLDERHSLDSGLLAIHDYVVARLDGVSDAMDPEAVARVVAETTHGSADRPFLLARLVTDQLRATPLDTSAPDWRNGVSTSIEAAFDSDLATAADPGLARAMLTALTWALGNGFPEEEWLTVVRALSTVEVQRRDVSALLDQLGRYVLQDGEGGVAVYRVAHQALADHLRPPYRETADAPFDPAAATVASALLTRFRTLLESGQDAVYLERYAWQHSAIAGPVGLTGLRELAPLVPGFARATSRAALLVASTFDDHDRTVDVLPLVEDAVAERRALAEDGYDEPRYFALTLAVLAGTYDKLGRHSDAVTAAEEAVARCRDLTASDPGYEPELAAVLDLLSSCYAAVGRHTEAREVAEEVVTLQRALATADRTSPTEVADALNGLGLRYASLGLDEEALAVTEESVATYRAVAANDLEQRPRLATALTNLGRRYLALGRGPEAVAPIEEALALHRKLAGTGRRGWSSLAGTLDALAVCYSSLDRHEDALAPAEEAVELYRRVVMDDSGETAALAGALTNLGGTYGDLNRRHEALAANEESVALRRNLVRADPASRLALAHALINLAIDYREAGRHEDALAVAEESVTIHQEIVAEHPASPPDCTRALLALAGCYSDVGRYTDAVAAADEAVHLGRARLAENRGSPGDLAAALADLGAAHQNAGRPDEALLAVEECVAIRRELAEHDGGDMASLAAALASLGILSRLVRRYEEALRHTEESVELARPIARHNPAAVPFLAGTMSNLAIFYSEFGRPWDAVAAAEESVTLARGIEQDDPAELGRALFNLSRLYRSVHLDTQANTAAEQAVAICRELARDGEVPMRKLADALAEVRGDVDRLWLEILAELPATAAAELLGHRANAATGGDPRAVAWLVDAIACPGLPPWLTGWLHDQARRHHDLATDDWQTAWCSRTGEPAPDWLVVRRDLLATARDWIATPTYRDEQGFLAQHGELLDPEADVAIREALLAVDEQERQAYLARRAIARVDGLDEAYRDLVLTELAHQFVTADPAGQGLLLAEHGDELRSEEVTAILVDLAAGGDGAAVRALFLPELSAADQEALAETLAAMANPDAFPALLTTVSTSANAESVLAGVATAALGAARTESESAAALFYLAVAGAITGDEEVAANIRAARGLDPAHRDAWLRQLARIGARHPAALALIDALTAEDEDGDD